MRNAKKELLKEVKDTAKIKCASILYGQCYTNQIEIILKVGYVKEDYANFLKSLDFSYDSGFGGQELFGTIWLEDGTWLTRGEYDGSEWWEHNVLPPIPEECL